MNFKCLVLFQFAVLVSCGPTTSSDAEYSTVEEEVADPKGIGEIKTVNLDSPLDADMVKRGKVIYEMKCSPCHKLTDQSVVGPGWLGITQKRSPEWIMNMITNVDIMLEKDPDAGKMLADCLIRMPDLNVSIEEAREILEFMRELDGQK